MWCGDRTAGTDQIKATRSGYETTYEKLYDDLGEAVTDRMKQIDLME